MPDTHEDGANLSTGVEVKGHQTGGRVGMGVESDGVGEQSGGGLRDMEVCYLAQLRRPQFPIGGIYKLSHNSAHNHFRRYSDIKHRGEGARLW